MKKLNFYDWLFITVITFFILGSNFHDWDQHSFFNYFDYSSIWHFKELPLWSFQQCAGGTRIGDPQALGLSPLFITILILGPIWGAKINAILLTIFGYLGLNKLIFLIYHSNDKAPFKHSISFICFIFLVSNFFLWHHAVGFANFLNNYTLIIVGYFLVKAHKQNLTKIEKLLFFIFSWHYFSAYIYATNMFIVMPILLSFCLYSLMYPKNMLVRSLFNLNIKKVSPFIFGFLFSLPKLWGVFSYNLANPRSVETRESYSFLEIIEQIFIPTFDYNFITRDYVNHLYGVHELSSFSLILFLTPFLIFWSKRDQNDTKIFVFCMILAVISICFSMGYFNSFAPFSMLNHLLSHSVRVSPRFEIGVVISFFIIAVHLVMKSSFNLSKFTRLAFTFLVMINLASFYPFISFEKLITNSKIDYSAKKLNSQILEVPWNMQWPYTLADHLSNYASGSIIRNCYNPLFLGQSMTNKSKMNLTNSQNEICIRDSYVTQNNLYISSACEKDLCLNLREMPSHLAAQWKYRKSSKQFCRGN